ncbi:LysM peptidoglycan-binding domain-containing protein [Micromonospora rubida]|uniref:LysM peptidoglycan-binding domain-containing protein n=1 Tax=Micromonospora rubida TaxID=2697657 RepID=A0ABW7SJ74_9ACTN
MPDPTSRYADTPIATIDVPDGAGGRRTVRYLLRRFPPPAAASPTLAEHLITDGDRLDLLSARYLGDPTQYWRICDANLVIHPDELTAADRVGQVLRIPVPQV